MIVHWREREHIKSYWCEVKQYNTKLERWQFLAKKKMYHFSSCRLHVDAHLKWLFLTIIFTMLMCQQCQPQSICHICILWWFCELNGRFTGFCLFNGHKNIKYWLCSHSNRIFEAKKKKKNKKRIPLPETGLLAVCVAF